MNKTEKTNLVKNGVDVVVGVGVSEIIGSIIQSNVQPGNMAQRFCVFAAKHVVVAMATERTTKFTDEKIDNTITWWEENTSATRRSNSEREPQGEDNAEEQPEEGRQESGEIRS